MTPPSLPFDRRAPTLPVEFVRLVLTMAAERGIAREAMLAGIGIPDAVVDAERAFVSIEQHEALLRRAAALSAADGSMAYELGLRVGLTTYALAGYALLSQQTIGDAIRLGVEFSQLFVPVYRGAFFEEDGSAVIDVQLDMPVEDRFYSFAYDLALVTVWGGLRALMGGSWPEAELWFDYPEPAYYAAWRDRLPVCRFDMGANQVCFPAAHLARRIQTGDPVMAKLVVERLLREREARLGQGGPDIVAQVSERLVRAQDGYPDLETVAAQLAMSTRTLKRKLQQAGSGFQLLLDAARQRDAMRLLRDSRQSIEEIAAWIGFAEPANFTHAFRRWTGTTPSEWRERERAMR